MTTKVSIYIRCSTIGQDTKSQRHELEQYCARQGWTIYKVYEDKAISGSKADRPALNEMLVDVRNGCAGDLIAVYKIDRLARSVSDLLRILTDLKACNVGFCSVSQGIDTSTSYGKMVLTFLGAVAEFERETIVERVRCGIAKAKADGVQLGRPRVAIDIKKAIKLRDEGLGYKQIARVMNIPRTTLFRTLQAIPKTHVA